MNNTIIDVPAFLQAKFVLSEGNNTDNIEDALLKTDPVLLQLKNPVNEDKFPGIKAQRVAVKKVLRANYDYQKVGSIRFVFRVANQPAIVPRAFVDVSGKKFTNAQGDKWTSSNCPSSLVIYCDQKRLVEAFSTLKSNSSVFSTTDLKNALTGLSGKSSFLSFLRCPIL